MKLPFATVILTLAFGLVLSSTASPADGILRSESTEAGPIANGASLRIEVPKRAVLGKPILIRMEIRNVAGTTLRLLAPEVALNYLFDAADASTGKRVPKRIPPRSGADVYSGGGMRIPAGNSYFFTVRLDDILVFEAPGRYRVRVFTAYVRRSGAPRSDLGLASNAVSFDLLPTWSSAQSHG